MESDWENLDRRMQPWSSRVRDDLNVRVSESMALASAMGSEIRALPLSIKDRIKQAGPVSLTDRLDELKAFQAWQDIADGAPHPAVVRAQVIVQNYVCFVYLSDSLFRELRRALPINTTTVRCATFLTENPVKAFRNAFAHANWRYLPTFDGLEFWAWGDAGRQAGLQRWEVRQIELDFWQALARCTAYVAGLELKSAAA